MSRFVLCAALAGLCLTACDSPVDTKGGRAYIAVTTGGDHTCALETDGTAYCWGSNNYGELGTGNKDNTFRPAKVQTDLKFKDITAGDTHTCALTNDGQAWCWGFNFHYQRGNTDAGGDAPVPVQTNVRFKSISAGAHHTCAIEASEGRVYCWGYNKYGQSGAGTTFDVVRPDSVRGGLRAVAVSAGGFHTCALTAAGAAFCWGSNEFSQLAIGSDSLYATVPTEVRTPLVFTSIDAGATHTCAIAEQAVYCWGSSSYGELGDAAPFMPGLIGRATPTKVPALSNVTQISAGEYTTCALLSNGDSDCWGKGSSGQIGEGPTENAAAPRPLSVGTGLHFSLLAAGGRTHMCGLADHAIFCWGTGPLGQLGAGERVAAAQALRVIE